MTHSATHSDARPSSDGFRCSGHKSNLAAVCVAIVTLLATAISSDAQDQKDPPKEFANSLGMKFAWIPPGTFLMGSPTEEKHRNPIEIPHKVTLTKGFYMGVHPVTQDQWLKVMGGKNPSGFDKEKMGDKEKLSAAEKLLLPVESVSWNDCQEFIKKLQEMDMKPYRLPTCERRAKSAAGAGRKVRHLWANEGDSWRKVKRGGGRSPLCAGLSVATGGAERRCALGEAWFIGA